MIQMMIAGSTGVKTPLKQTKKDINCDVTRELNGGMDHRLGEHGSNAPRVSGGFVPEGTKRDKSGYYNQFANRDPSAVNYAMWDPDERRFRFYAVSCLDFGSIHAVW